MANTPGSDMLTLPIHKVITLIGEYGRYQKYLSVIFGLINIPMTFQILIMYFSTLTPTWRCVGNSSSCIWNGTFPGDDRRRCLIPREDWEYTEPKEFSLVTSFELHCSKEPLLFATSSILFIGWGISSPLFGWLADNYGRRWLIMPSLSATLIIGFFSSFLPNIYLIIASRFIIGVLIPGATVQGYVLVSEVVSNRKRPLAGLLVYATMPIAFAILGVKAYLLKNWVYLSICCTAPYLVLTVFSRFIPESVEWLQMKGKLDEVMQIFIRMAQCNKKSLSPTISISPPSEVHTQKSHPLDLFKSRRIGLYAIVHCFTWFSCAMGYFGLSMAANDLGGSAYRDFVLLSLCELPAFASSIYFCTSFGRKPTALLSAFLGSATLLVVAHTPSHLKLIRVIFGLSGKYFITIGFSAITVWTRETFSTRQRSLAMGYGNISARGGSIAAQYVVTALKVYGKWVPFSVIGIFMLLVSLLGISLPETKDGNEEECCENEEVFV